MAGFQLGGVLCSFLERGLRRYSQFGPSLIARYFLLFPLGLGHIFGVHPFDPSSGTVFAFAWIAYVVLTVALAIVPRCRVFSWSLYVVLLLLLALNVVGCQEKVRGPRNDVSSPATSSSPPCWRALPCRAARRLLAGAPDGSHLAVGTEYTSMGLETVGTKDSPAKVLVVDVGKRAVVRTLETPGCVEGLAFSPDGNGWQCLAEAER